MLTNSMDRGHDARDPQAGRIQAEDGQNPSRGAEEYFQEAMVAPLRQAQELGEAEIVVGVPFYNEVDTIASVLQTAAEGLREYYPGRKCVIVAVGCPAGREALSAAEATSVGYGIDRIAFLLDHEKISGKGWATWAIMEIARTLGADLVLLEADLRSRDRDGVTEGLAPEWVSRLLEPIKMAKADLVVSRFARHCMEAPLSDHVFYPLLTAIYDCPIHDLTGGQWGISYYLLRSYLKQSPYPPSMEAGGYGADSWLATTAAITGATICEAHLGIKVHRPSLAKAELVLTQAARVLFDRAPASYARWEKTDVPGEQLVKPLATFGTKSPHRPDEVPTVPEQLVDKYRQSYSRFHTLFEWALPGELFSQLDILAETDAASFHFSHALWAQIVYHLILASTFTTEYAEGDLVSALVTGYEGHLASSALEMQALRDRLASLDREEAEHLVCLEASRQVELMVDEFIRIRPDFLAAWESSEEARKPPVPNVTYREFIPGVPLVVPSELATPEGTTVSVNVVYETIFHGYKRDFDSFIYEKLGIPRRADSMEIVSRLRDFMLTVETELAHTFLTDDLNTVPGTQAVVDAIFAHFSRQDTFSLVPEMASWLLWRYPPTNLLTKLGYTYLDELLTRHAPNDVLALASWTEEHDYKDQVGALFKESIRTEHFVAGSLRPIVVDLDEYPSLAGMKESPSLSRVAGRLVGVYAVRLAAHASRAAELLAPQQVLGEHDF